MDLTTKPDHSPDELKGFKRQHCSVCRCEEKFNFHVPDDTWKNVVPEEYRQRVVCLSCFDEFARRSNIDYSDAIKELYFAGDKVTVKFGAISTHTV
jgi:hypothetical protein